MAKNRWVPILVAVIGGGVLYYLYHFNQKPSTYERYLLVNITTLFWIPMLLVIFTRQEPSAFGFGLGDAGRGAKYAGLLFLGVLPALVFASRLPEFQGYYPIQHRAAHDLAYFIYYEITYGMYLFCWEFFFRGFLLFGLWRLIGSWSVFVQAVAFGIMHIGKPGPEVAASFAAGVILGIVALRTKSFMPCFVLHWAVAVAFDVLVIAASRGLLF